MTPARRTEPPARAVEGDYLTLSMYRHAGRTRLTAASELDLAPAPALDGAIEQISQLDQSV